MCVVYCVLYTVCCTHGDRNVIIMIAFRGPDFLKYLTDFTKYLHTINRCYCKERFNWHWLESKTMRDILFPCACMNVRSSFAETFFFPDLEQRATGIPALTASTFHIKLIR